eukprot:CAMPEP_0119283440 /NCGR_PEP_ID=MMETSP1329-20130426/28490_1 /TAXON_ID=114041 /ORGANISM="Genus nov. species nov., Strain RCC1024" /LENGTH=38 /DNA_ID= /DNA_START= /DNA_END= /DNA_ORIENTATION=
MAGRGRGSTLPAWMTSGTSGSADAAIAAMLSGAKDDAA